MTAVLEVEGLTVALRGPDGPVVVVDGVDLTVEAGRTRALVGESGAGKSVTGRSLLGLLDPRAFTVLGGQVRYRGTDLLTLPERRLEDVRGREIAMIFQEPRRNLDPHVTVGAQIAAVARRHLGLPRRAARDRAVEVLELVELPAPERCARSYPHELSGGMCQRVLMAMALVAEPSVLVADEPTTALDVTVQAQVLGLLARLQASMGLGVVLITHDLGVVAEVADDVTVLYAGRVVESGPVERVLLAPRHPYTAGLLASVPADRRRGDRLGAIEGAVPLPGSFPGGCRFHPRCPHRTDACTATEPALVPGEGPGVAVRCHLADQLDLRGVR